MYMITLILGEIQQADVLVIIGYVTAGLEVLLVLIKFLQYIVNPKSKFGIFLAKLLKGIKFLKDTADDATKSMNDDNKGEKEIGRDEQER